MVRCNHTQHALPSFPVYSIGFVADDKVVLGGGGGASRSGIKNKLRLYNVDSKSLDLVNELELDPGEDAPMSMAIARKSQDIICGINSTLEKRKNDNQNCRVYHVSKEDKLEKKQTTSTLTIENDEDDDYQKVTTLSPDGGIFAVGSTNNQVALLSFPALEPIASPFDIPKSGGDVFDVDFYDEYAVICGSKTIYFVRLPSSKLGKRNAKTALEVATTVALPTLPGLATGTTCSFRAARMVNNNDSEGQSAGKLLYAVVNTTPPRSARGGSRAAFVCVFQQQDKSPEWGLVKNRSASSKAITVFDVNGAGTLLAYGSSDLSIGILDAKTLAVSPSRSKSDDDHFH
ncbi:hypothetical protein M407DRAFT_156595 [Tulasnella calospora MUT 4182]|uniref:Uncharacterized protein n=1 Tax=Tulasnella calospora MUT 4182 TaxID=1051891 RepID=A0A0C3M8Z1_9AGAM|nr:hypothetical protein M407DRAFT_156595 [Tulasnella calospora MUT 4182]